MSDLRCVGKGLFCLAYLTHSFHIASIQPPSSRFEVQHTMGSPALFFARPVIVRFSPDKVISSPILGRPGLRSNLFMVRRKQLLFSSLVRGGAARSKVAFKHPRFYQQSSTSRAPSQLKMTLTRFELALQP